MSATTKTFLAALTAKGYASSRSSFVVPSLDGQTCFVDLRSRKCHDAAYVVFVGRSIGAEDVLQKLAIAPPDLDRVRRLVESLIVELKRFKVGNVVAVEQSDGEQVKLRLVANGPKTEPGPKLP